MLTLTTVLQIMYCVTLVIVNYFFCQFFYILCIIIYSQNANNVAFNLSSA